MDEARARELLSRERERIERQLANLRSDANVDDEDSGDPADGAALLQDQEVDAGLEEGLRADLDAIQRAEERLANGTYGVSIESGEPIPDQRLEALPWAERTAEEDEHHQGHR
jgi:RNA polymerase-binding transcription factor